MSLAQPLDRRAQGASLLLAVLVLGGCVSPNEAGVGVRDMEANIVFGVKDDGGKDGAGGSALATGEFLTGPEAISPGEVQFLPEQRERPTVSKPKFTPALRPANACPPAAANTFAETAAPLNVTEAPKVGSYRWKKGGEAEFTLIPNQKFPISGFEQRLVTESAKVANSPDNPAPGLEFVFKVVQPDGNQGQAVTTYRVKTMARSVSANPSFTDARARTGVPGRGVAIEKVEKFDRSGGRVDEFAPSTPLLVFPLEVVQGESFQSSAVDPKTGRSIQIQAQVKERVEVDACGKILSGWLVDGTRTESGGGGPQPYKYVVAPQMGGMVISEEYFERTAEGAFTRKFNIGQQDPDPLPDGSK